MNWRPWVPPLVTQIAGGEHGGVMMTSSPQSISGHLQPLFHIGCGSVSSSVRDLNGDELRAGDNLFSMEGGSWTNDI